MAGEKAITPHRSARSNVAASRKEPNAVERMKGSEFPPAASDSNGAVGFVYGAAPQALLDAVEDQRVNLLNVLGIVHCMSASFVDTAEDRTPEISAAFALLEEEIQRVATGLEEVSLRAAM
jgi:hypothetical protein